MQKVLLAAGIFRNFNPLVSQQPKEILDRKVEFATPWFELLSKHVRGESAPYYSLRMQDYVAIVALTEAREMLLVRQYRPAVERYTLELPCGHVEKNETPEESARRELAEECGFDAGGVELLGKLMSDTGRSENNLWCFLSRAATPMPAFTPEAGVERVLVPASRIPDLIASGDFAFSMHLAALLLAMLKPGGQLIAL